MTEDKPEWEAEWRRLTVQLSGWWDGRDMKGALSLVHDKAERADRHDDPMFAYELQKALERLDREVQIYADRLEEIRKDIGYFIAAVVQHRTLLAQLERDHGRPDALDDDEIVDRLAAFYNLPKQGPK